MAEVKLALDTMVVGAAAVVLLVLRPGQLVIDGLHWVMVTVLVMVLVEVVVLSPSVVWAVTAVATAARTP